MAEDRDQQQFRTLGDRYRARARLRRHLYVPRIISDDALTAADIFLNGEEGNDDRTCSSAWTATVQ